MTPQSSRVHTATPAAPEWQPPIPLSQITQAAIDKAATLRHALARVLELRGSPNTNARELEAIGLADYRRRFGHGITDRTLRALVKRTVDRDAGRENWNRLEIYLDGNPQRKAAAPSIDFAAALEFRELHDCMATFKSATAPSVREREAVWVCAVKLFDRQVIAGADARRARVALVAFLWRSAPWLARSRNALRVAFQTKYDQWIEDGRAEAALRDGRHARLGIPTKPPIPQVIIDSVVSCAIEATGLRLAQSKRKVASMADELGLDPEMVQLLNTKAACKSAVNHRLREATRYDVKEQGKYLNTRTRNNGRPSLDLDYSNIPSGFCYSSDDVTLPVYWHVPDGKGWFNLVRGQCLVTIDFRTLRILGFSLQPDRNYSSPVIHTNFTTVFTDWGVPEIMLLERGIWKNSKLITGGPKAATNHPDYQFLPFSWPDTERGFGDLGVKFHHARDAKGKSQVEGVMRLVQALMEAEPGYCGRDERFDKPQICKEHEDDVNARRVHPGKYFYDFAQWNSRLIEIFAEYNATPQQGKLIPGMSPNEAQERLQDPDRAPRLFDDTCRHWLAHYRVVKQVGKDGVKITIGKKSWTYRSERLGRDKWKKVLCWFNPDEPSVLAVTDLNMRNPYSVPLAHRVGALEAVLDPDSENYREEVARVAAFESHGRARYQALKANFAPKFRRMVPNRATVETGQAMRQQRELIEVNRKQDDTRKRGIQRRAGELGLPSRILNTGPEADEGTRLMLEAEREHARVQLHDPTPEKSL